MKATHTPTFLYAGSAIDQVEMFKDLGTNMHPIKRLTAAMKHLCKAAKRAMFGLHGQCLQLHIYEPIVRCHLFDALAMLFYGAEV